MNIPNIITAIRVVLSFCVAILLCIKGDYIATIAFVLFFIASITDMLDGYIARKYGQVTNIGKFMDALCDKIMVIGLLFIMIGLNQFKEWNLFIAFCALITVSREFFVSGIRMLAAKENVVIAAEKLGKFKAIFQMFGLGAIIFTYAIETDFNLQDTKFYEIVFLGGIICLAISTLLCMISGIGYAFKYSHLLKTNDNKREIL